MVSPAAGVDTCEECFDGLVALLEPEAVLKPLVIAMPAALYYNQVCADFRWYIRKQPKNFRRVLLPFSLDALSVLREYMLSEHLDAGLGEPMQTTGMRGGAKKTWKMRTSDTLSFKLIVGRDFKDGAVPAVGTGLFYDESALTAWLPPLEMVCTRVPLVGGGAREQCVLQICQMSSGRITEHGFDFTRQTLRKTQGADLAMKQKYLAKLIFALQAKRVGHNATAAVGDTLPLLDHALLVLASGYL